MEGNDNYEPLNRRPPDLYRTIGGALSEKPVQSEICDSDLERTYSCYNEMDQIIRELDSVERICDAMIKKFQAPEGPLTSHSDVSQCSMENTAVISRTLAIQAEKAAETPKKREKFIPPINVIDLTSEDSCDSSTSRRIFEDRVDFGEVQSPMANSIAIGGTGPRSPPFSPPVTPPVSLAEGSPLKRKQPDPPGTQCSPLKNGLAEATVISDDDDDVRYDPYVWSSEQPVEKVSLEEDALADVWEEMARALRGAGTPVPIPVAPIKKLKAKKCKVNVRVKRKEANPNDVAFYDVSHEHPTIMLASEVNELVQVEISPSRTKRPRGRPRKDVGTPQVGLLTKERKERANKSSNKVKVKETQHIEAQEGIQAQTGTLEAVEERQKKKQRKVQDVKDLVERGGKRHQGTRAKEKVGGESEEEEEEEDDEDCEPKGDAEDVEEEIKVTSSLNGEKVDYEPYIWKNKEEMEEEDEIEDLFKDMNIATATTLPQRDSNSPEPSLKNNGCEHKDFTFTEESGFFCMDCGTVGRDIQSLFLLSETPKGVRKHVNKDPETTDGVWQFNLKVQDSSTKEVLCGADFKLHPYFEEHLHPHQKKGFKFLTENLLGDKQPKQESVGCVLAHAPGTGKTCLMISFVQSYLSSFPEGRAVILAPKIMLNSWQKEFEHWKVQEIPIYNLNQCLPGDGPSSGFEYDEEDEKKLPSHVTKSLKESRARVLQDWQAERGVLLMSYTLFQILVYNGQDRSVAPDSLESQISTVLLNVPNLVILDEGHLARNIKTKLSQALILLKTRRRVLLSGTLFQNNFKELYTLLKLCRDDFMISHPIYANRIADYFRSLDGPDYTSGTKLMQFEEKIFTDEIGDKLESYVKSGEVRNEEIEPVVKKLQSLTASFVNWYPGEILKSLPGLFEYSIHLNLTPVQLKRIAGLPAGTSHMSRQCMILNACIHPSLVNKGDDVNVPFPEPNAMAPSTNDEYEGVKMTFLLQLLGLCVGAKEKLLIFCTTLAPLKYIEEMFCRKWSWQKGQHILRLDGTMQESDRQKVIEQFNRKDAPSQVLLASTKACKEGITLVGASRVVIVDNPDNPSVVRQAVSRAFRIGQERKVFVYRLVTTYKEEEDIFRRSVNKERLSKVLLDPVSTMARLGGFLQEQGASEIEDKFLQTLMQNDSGKYINLVNRYNATGSF